MRNKYRAIKVKGCPHCGRTHDSKAEAKECEYWHLMIMDKQNNIKHIDVHPTVTLPGNIRWVLDFCIWRDFCYGCAGYEPIFIDVKGVLTADFKLKRKLFDSSHPAAPLICVRWQGKNRIVME